MFFSVKRDFKLTEQQADNVKPIFRGTMYDLLCLLFRQRIDPVVHIQLVQSAWNVQVFSVISILKMFDAGAGRERCASIFS